MNKLNIITSLSLWAFVFTIILAVMPPNENKAQIYTLPATLKKDVPVTRITIKQQEFNKVDMENAAKVDLLTKKANEAAIRADNLERELKIQKQIGKKNEGYRNLIDSLIKTNIALNNQLTEALSKPADTVMIVRSRPFPFVKTKIDTIYSKNNF